MTATALAATGSQVAAGVCRDAIAPSRGGERGQVGGVEGLLLGVLVFVLGTLVVANAWGVIDARMTVDDAAREALRAYVQAPDQAVAGSQAEAAAAQVMAASGRDPGRLKVVLNGELTRCAVVVAVASYRVPVVGVPLVGGHAGFVVSAREVETVDPFRDGLPGKAPCG